MFTKIPSDIKLKSNIQRQMEKLAEVKLIPQDESGNRGLINLFRNIIANEAQRQDLLNFHHLGTEHLSLMSSRSLVSKHQ